MSWKFNPFTGRLDFTASSIGDLTTKDHDLLDGLSDDDHTQYVLVDGTRTIDSITLSGGGATVDTIETTLTDDDTHIPTSGAVVAGGVTRSEWGQNGFEDKTDVSLSWDDGTMTLSISPAVDSFSYYIDGVKYTETDTLTETITDTEGLWVFYFDSEGSITSANSPSTADIRTVIRDYAIIAYVYWDATNSDGRLMPELHGYTMSPETHVWMHFTQKAQYISGMAPGDLNVDESGGDPTHAQFSLGAGAFRDEDIYIALDAVAEGAAIEIWYRDGNDGDWRWTTTTITGDSFPVIPHPVESRIAFNEWTGATWQQGDPGDNDFVLCHIFATNITDDSGENYKYIAIQGQADYNTLGNARDGATTELQTIEYGTLPLEEVIPVATFIYQTNDFASWNGSKVHARIRSTDTGDEYIDWRESLPQGVSGSATDHGNLSGLVDDDHSQYVLEDGTRDIAMAPAGTWSVTDTDSDNLATFTSNGNVALYYDNTLKFETTAAGISITDGTATAATIGFSNDDLQIKNNDPDGIIQIYARNTGDSADNLVFAGDPDGASELYYAGTKILETATHGYIVYNSSGEYIAWNGNLNQWSIVSRAHGYPVVIQGENNSGTLKNLFKADPDGNTDIYRAGVAHLSAGAAGYTLLYNNNATQWATLGFGSTTNFSIRSKYDSAHIVIEGDNAASTLKTCADFDPDASVALYYAGTKEAETISGGFTITNGKLTIPSIKSGATQAAAGAAANEVWKTSSHATLPDNVLLIGV